MKIYYTQYVTTNGIRTFELEYDVEGDRYYSNERDLRYTSFYKDECFTSYDKAKERAKLLISRKLKSIERQKIKLKKILDNL